MFLELPLADVQPRFDYQSVSREPLLAGACATLPTGLRELDELLDGGLLCGASHCVSGEAASGAASLLYRAMANAQSQGVAVVYLNIAGRIDQCHAEAAGVELGRLSLFDENSLKRALSELRGLARTGKPALLAVDLPADAPLARLKAILRHRHCTLLALSPTPLLGMRVTLECRRQSWRLDRGAAIGFISELRLTSHPFLPYRQVRAAFDMPRESRVDQLLIGDSARLPSPIRV